MKFKILCFFFMLIIFGCAKQESPQKESSFDLACNVFNTLALKSDFKTLSHTQRNAFIVKKLNELAPNSPATLSWDAVSYADPQQRYEIFKAGAEATLEKSWSCESMKNIVSITGAV